MGNTVGSTFFKTSEKEVTGILKGKTIIVDGSFYLYKYCAVYRYRDGRLFSNHAGVVTAHIYGLINLISNLYTLNAELVFTFEGVKVIDHKQAEVGKRIERKNSAKTLLNALKRADSNNFALLKRLEQQSFSLTSEILDLTKRFLQLAGIRFVFAEHDGQKTCYQLSKQIPNSLIATDDWDIIMYGGTILRNLLWQQEDTRIRAFGQVLNVDSTLENLGLTKSDIINCVCVAGCDYTEGLAGYGPKKAIKLVKEPDFLESKFYIETICSIKEYITKPALFQQYRPILHYHALYELLVTELDFNPEKIFNFLTVVAHKNKKQI